MKSANHYAQASMLDAVAALAALARRTWLRYIERWEARATRAILRSLDEHTLRDVGLRRSEIDSMTSSRIYGLD